MSAYVFVVTQVGSKESNERRRADEVSDHIIKPVIDIFDLELRRSDREAAPGQITAQILKLLIEADVVVADLTGKNPNVYYELAIAHAFAKPVVGLIDDTSNVAFDIKDERLIALGTWADGFKIVQAEEAKTALEAAFRSIMVPDYRPTSLVTEVASARSLEGLAPSDPVASELALIRDSLDDIKEDVRRQSSDGTSRDDLKQAKLLIEKFAAGQIRQALSEVDLRRTTMDFDEFVEDTTELFEKRMARRSEARNSAQNALGEARRDTDSALGSMHPSPSRTRRTVVDSDKTKYPEEPPF